MKPGGIIHTPYNLLKNVPSNPQNYIGENASIEVFPEFASG